MAVAIVIMATVSSIAAEPAIDKLPEKAKQAIAAYEKAVEREKANLIDVLDKLQPETQPEIAAVKTYLQSIQGDKAAVPATKKLKTSKLTRRKLGDSFIVFNDPNIKLSGLNELIKIDNGVLSTQKQGKVLVSPLDVKNGIIEFDYRLSSSLVKSSILVRHCYGGLPPDNPVYGCYTIQIGGNGTSAISGGAGGGQKNQTSRSIPKNKVFEQQDQWNKMEIVVEGREISVFVNGRFANKAEGLIESGGELIADVFPGLELRNMKITMLE